MIESFVNLLHDNIGTVIAICAFVLTVYQAYLTRRHNRLSVKPHFSTFSKAWYEGEDWIWTVTLSNCGLGPAIIEKYEILLDDVVVEAKNPGDLLTELSNRLKLDPISGKSNAVLLAPGYVFAKEESLEIGRVHFKSTEAQAFDQNRLQIRITYHSIYDEHDVYVSRMHKPQEPEEEKAPEVITVADEEKETASNATFDLIQQSLKAYSWKIGSAIPVIGGIFALIFFGHIGYLPDVDLQNATSMLVSIALLGLFFTVVIGGCLIFPGWLLRILVAEKIIPQDKKAAFYAALVAVASVIGSVVAGEGTILTFLLVLSMLILGVGAGSLIGEDPQKRKFKPGAWFTYLMLWALWVFASTIAMFPFAGMYQVEGISDWEAWLLLGSWLIWVPSANTYWGLMARKFDVRLALATGVGSLAVLMSLTANPAVISIYAFRTLGLGEIQNAEVVVKRSACDSLKHLVPDVCGGTGDSIALKQITLLSRLGSEYMITMPCSIQAKDRRVFMKKDDVLGWSMPSKVDKKVVCLSTKSADKN